MTPIELALVGFGKWGRNYVTAIEDSGEARLAQVVRRGDVLHNVDAVIYAGHPSGAAEAVEACMTVGKPILVEKPAGLSLDDANRIAAAEAVPSRFGLPAVAFVLVGHQHLFAEGYEALVDWRKDHVAGAAHADWRGPGPARDYSALWDYGPHAVSVLLGLRHAESWWRPGPFLEHVEADADKALMIWFQGTERVQARVSRVHDRKEARVYFWDPVGGEHGPSYDAYAPAEPALTRQVRAFAKAVRDKGTDDWRFGAKWAVDVARILESAAP